MSKFSLIIPIYNEEDAITRLFQQLESYSCKEEQLSEIILINDGSSDSSATRIQEELSKWTLEKSISIINNPYNLGYGASLKRGIRCAKETYVAIIDADLTYEIERVTSLHSICVHEDLEMVVGARQGKFYEGNLTKKLLRKLLRRIVEYMTGQKILDINSGLRIFKRDLALENEALLSNRFSFTTSLTLVIILSGGLVRYVPTNYERRLGSTKVKLAKDAFKTLGQILAVSFYFNPLRVIYPIILFQGAGTLFLIALGIFATLDTLLILIQLCSFFVTLTVGLLSQSISLARQTGKRKL
jgi:glycosyltransferase involved in cell wall biosynthesis